MIEFLSIENIAVAKDISISFCDKFNVLTGETGAGKSIIIDSINMLLGSKISKDIIRHGEKYAKVNAIFSNVGDEVYSLCDELGIFYDREDDFSISRTLNSDGKNVIKINSKPASLLQLREIGQILINIHGQNENQLFINADFQCRLLDEYSKEEELLCNYKKHYSELIELKSKIQSLEENRKNSEMVIDLYRFQLKEISNAKLTDDAEEDRLLDLKNKLKNSEKIIKLSSNVYKFLYKNESGISVYTLIEKALDSLTKLSENDKSLEESIHKLESYKYEIQDIAEKTKDFAVIDLTGNPENELEKIEDRLTVLQRIKKKYGDNISSVLQKKKELTEKISEIENLNDEIKSLIDNYKELYSSSLNIAEKIHDIRVKNAEILSNEVLECLKYLDMPKVKFRIDVSVVQKNSSPVLNSNGYDRVEFLIATNPGDDLAPMSRIASGGELSRIMLAIKSAISDKNSAQTVIFDEIDTGVSGSTSQKIGVKLSSISKNIQTICVTHSAQIASLADNHYLIRKQEVNGRAEASVSLLTDEEKVNEIARIIGGINLTDKQYEAAKELVIQSKKLKNE